MVVFTSICANYLHKARLLSKSAKDNLADATFIVCLLEREMKPEYEFECFDGVVLAKDAWGAGFDEFVFKHRIVEASTAVKAQFFIYLQDQFPQETHFVYLDPDIYVYDDFVELKDALSDNPIVLCPHLLQPGNIDMEISCLAHGVYNLGFLAVNRSAEAASFLKWWADRLSVYCIDDIPRGLFTDQRWMDLAPCFFQTYVLKHRGYDFAIWSLLDCCATETNGKVFIKGDPLRFAHFSDLETIFERCMDDWLPPGEKVVHGLYDEYKKLHTSYNSDGISRSSWSYATYFSGEKISDSARIFFRDNRHLFPADTNPYSLSDGEIENPHSLTVPDGETENPRRLTVRTMEIINKEGLRVFIKKAPRRFLRRVKRRLLSG